MRIIIVSMTYSTTYIKRDVPYGNYPKAVTE